MALRQTSDNGWVPRKKTWYLVRSKSKTKLEPDEINFIYRPEKQAYRRTQGGGAVEIVQVDCVWNIKFTDDIEDVRAFFVHYGKRRPRYNNQWAENLESYCGTHLDECDYQAWDELKTSYNFEVIKGSKHPGAYVHANGKDKYWKQTNATNFLTFVVQEIKTFERENRQTTDEQFQRALVYSRHAKTQLKFANHDNIALQKVVDAVTTNNTAIAAIVDAQYINPYTADLVEEKDLDSILLRNSFTRDRRNNYSKKPLIHLWYILNASVIAGIGLATNSAPVVVASMLVSSMMEPIKGMATAMRHVLTRDETTFHLRRFAWHLLTLFIDVLLCLLVGLLVGSIVQAQSASDPDLSIMEELCGLVYTKNDGSYLMSPAEVVGRGKVSGLAISAIVAVASALALITADKQDNKSALVGIGISASLLPPAVNAGMLWSFQWGGKTSVYVDAHNVVVVSGTTFAEQGGVSLALTFVNVGIILLVWSAGYEIRKWFMRKHVANKDITTQPATAVAVPPALANQGGEETTPFLDF